MSSRFYWPFNAHRQLNTHRQSLYSPGEVSPGLHCDRITIYERTNGDENAVEVRKDHRAGRCMACG